MPQNVHSKHFENFLGTIIIPLFLEVSFLTFFFILKQIFIGRSIHFIGKHIALKANLAEEK